MTRPMSAVSEAVILMAGEGSRLRGSDKTFLKPFVPLLGRPLISYTLDALIGAGIKTVHFVVGYESERMIAQVKQLIPSGVNVFFIENRDWRKQNGISLLAAAGNVGAPFLLTMSDHLFDDAMVGRLLDNFDPGLLNIAIDRKLDSIFDLHDAMKVQTRGDKSPASGKICGNSMRLIPACSFVRWRSSTISSGRSPTAARMIAAWPMEFV